MSKNKTCFILLIVTLSLFSINVSAQLCDEPSSIETVRIYYANGMNTQRIRSEKTKIRIQNILGLTNKSYGTAYNHDEEDIKEFLKFVDQRKIESSLFWEWYENLADAPEWFREKYVYYLNRILNVENDPDLQDHIKQYLRDLRSGKKVLIVAHSQGNLYANLGYKYIRVNHSKYENSIGIVGIAAPTHKIEGGTASKTNFYSTNPLDKIIKKARIIYPNTLLANMFAFETGADDEDNHGILETYLNSNSSYSINHIVDRINLMISRLEPPPTAVECKPVEVSTLTHTQSGSNYTLRGKVKVGKSVDTWFILYHKTEAGNSTSSCLGTAGGQNGIGNGDTGEIFTHIVSSSQLYLSGQWLYSACGKDRNGNVASGTTRSINK